MSRQGALRFTIVAPSVLTVEPQQPLNDTLVGWVVDNITRGVSDAM
jgi:hypothetical protein